MSDDIHPKPTTYQFFYVAVPGSRGGFIKWKLDGETTDLDENMLNERQLVEVAALWRRIDTIGSPALVYDQIRDWATGATLE